MKDKSTGRVIGYTESVNLEDVEFKVSEAGRQRLLREKRKNVHAFAIGTVAFLIVFPVDGTKVA